MNILDGVGSSQEFCHEVYYAQPKKLDLSKIRKEAEDRQRGDFYKGPESTRVHFHHYDEPCEGHNHEQWDIRG